MKTVQAMLAEAEAEVPRISPDEAKGLLGRADVLFLDVREPAEVATSGKVPGAVAVPRGLVEFRADPASAMHDAAFDPRQDGNCVLCFRWTLSARRQDPEGHGLFQRPQSRRLQGLAGGGRRRGKGLIALSERVEAKRPQRACALPPMFQPRPPSPKISWPVAVTATVSSSLMKPRRGCFIVVSIDTTMPDSNGRRASGSS